MREQAIKVFCSKSRTGIDKLISRPNGLNSNFLKGGKHMKRALTLFVAVAVLLVAGHVMAGKVPTPESFEGITVVDADWVKANIGKVKVFDARKKGEYVEKHIPSAVSATYGEKSAKNLEFDSSKDKFKLKKYPKDKSTSLVVYCNGPKCWKSFKICYYACKRRIHQRSLVERRLPRLARQRLCNRIKYFKMQ